MAAASPSTPSRWLFGPLPDLLLGCGLLYALVVVVFALAGPAIRSHQPAFLVPLLIMLVSMPHYGGTLVRVYEQRADRRSYVIFSLWATLLVFAAFVAAIYDARIGAWLFTIYVTWSPWHYTGQNYGIAVLFLRRRGVAMTPAAKRWLHASYVLSFALTFLVFHGSFGEVAYSPEATAGAGVAFLPLGIPAVASVPLFQAAFAAYALCLAAAAALLLRAGSPRDLLPAAMVTLTQALWFSVPFAVRFFGLRTGVEPFDAQHLVRDYVFFVALGHAAQYLWVTTYYARASRGWHGYASYLGKTLASGIAVWTLPVVLFSPDALGRSEYNAGLALLVASAVNIHHFILDGAIWKLRHHRIANVLIRAAPAEVSAAPGAGASRWARRGIWGVATAGLAAALVAFWGHYFGYGAARARGDLASAAALLDRMAWIGRDSSSRRMEMASALERSGDAEGALRQYARAARLAPGAQPHVERARLLARAGRYEPAALELEIGLAHSPGDARIALAASRAWLRADQPDRARRVLERTLERSPDSPELHDALGAIAMQLGDAGTAVRHYRMAFGADPLRAGAGNNLAWILATSADDALRNPEESIQVARQLLAGAEPDPNSLDTLAAALAAAGRFEEALDTAARAEELARQRGDASMREAIVRRMALYRLGRPYVENASATDG